MVDVEDVMNKMQSQMRLHGEPEDDDAADLPLPALFDRASRLHALASSSALDQDGIHTGVDLLRRCDEMVSKLGLFSPNETKEDVSTANLKYLLVPYYLAEMTEKIAQEDRIPVLKASQDHLKEFIALCEVLELIPENELELSRQKQPDTMANRRAQKVARFKRQKAAETKLQEIRERKERRGRSLRAAALSAPIEAGEEDDLEDDGEEERESVGGTGGGTPPHLAARWIRSLAARASSLAADSPIACHWAGLVLVPVWELRRIVWVGDWVLLLVPLPMGGWNRSWHVRWQRDRPRRPPLPPPDYGQEHCSVPLWEREFCSYVGSISWQRFCENKRYISVCNILEHWDDSGAFENFQNSKARFWAHYHGQPSDISLPDPDMYIDKVDHRCKVDPELVADLDKVRVPFEVDNNSGLATGSTNARADKNQCGNWDIYVEKPSEVNWWDWEANSKPDLSWGVKNESSSIWGKSNSGWGDALEKRNWHGSSSDHYSSNNRNSDFYGGSNNRYQQEDPNHTSGRKRNSGEYFQQRNNKHRRQDERYQRSSWQDHRGRNDEWRPWR